MQEFKKFVFFYCAFILFSKPAAQNNMHCLWSGARQNQLGKHSHRYITTCTDANVHVVCMKNYGEHAGIHFLQLSFLTAMASVSMQSLLYEVMCNCNHKEKLIRLNSSFHLRTNIKSSKHSPTISLCSLPFHENYIF